MTTSEDDSTNLRTKEMKEIYGGRPRKLLVRLMR